MVRILGTYLESHQAELPPPPQFDAHIVGEHVCGTPFPRFSLFRSILKVPRKWKQDQRINYDCHWLFVQVLLFLDHVLCHKRCVFSMPGSVDSDKTSETRWSSVRSDVPGGVVFEMFFHNQIRASGEFLRLVHQMQYNYTSVRSKYLWHTHVTMMSWWPVGFGLIPWSNIGFLFIWNTVTVVCHRFWTCRVARLTSAFYAGGDASFWHVSGARFLSWKHIIVWCVRDRLNANVREDVRPVKLGVTRGKCIVAKTMLLLLLSNALFGWGEEYRKFLL